MIHDITCKLKAETEKAILVSVDGENFVWLPRSQIEIEYKSKDTVIVTAPEWLLLDKDLI
jgi:hypothetical protein